MPNADLLLEVAAMRRFKAAVDDEYSGYEISGHPMLRSVCSIGRIAEARMRLNAELLAIEVRHEDN